MDVALRIKQNIVRLDVSVYNPLFVYVSQRTSQLRNPEPNRFFRECFPRDVKSKISTVHQVHHKVPAQACLVGFLYNSSVHSHVFDILETVAQIANKLVVQMLQHPPFPQYVPHTLRPNNCWKMSALALRGIVGTF